MGEYEGYSFVFDLDGTLCPVKKPEEEYSELKPFPEMVEKLRLLKKEGARIIIQTSRNMRLYENNIGLINANTAKVVLSWLDRWDIPYDEIYYGKPWPGSKGFYVDDRTLRPSEFLRMNRKEMEEACAADEPQF